jgi:hypothetical protein
MPAWPMSIERRRLTVSATTPVGISDTNTAASMQVPTNTSWKGLNPAARMR